MKKNLSKLPEGQDTGLKTHSIRRRLLVAYGLMLAVIILLFGTALEWGLNRSFDDRLQSMLEGVIYDIKHDVLTQHSFKTGLLDPQEEFALSPVYIEAWLLERKKPLRMLYSANMADRHLPLRIDHAETFTLHSLPFISKADKSALLSMPATVDNRHYIITVATPIDKIDDVIEDFIQLFALFGFILYFIALFLGSRLINQVLLPMKSITATAASVSHNELSRRVPLPPVHDEFFTLAQTFNTMLGRIEKAFEKTKRFNANVSHELKTPLTIIRGEAEVTLLKKHDPETYESVLHSIMEESVSMQQIIDGMLLLSRSDTALLKKSMVPVRLDKILFEVFNKQKPAADAKGIRMTLTRTEPAEIIGEPQLLSEALRNLIDNAIKYTPENKNVTVAILKENGKIEIRIEDEGIGIGKEALPKIFDPFWREDMAHSKAVPGYGLGLSIVQWIVQAHKGSIKINSEKERGTVCVVKFS